MKIFENQTTPLGWGTKTNFVDENNVMLGYDSDQSCCEYAGWFIADSPQEDLPSTIPEVPDVSLYVFDTSYFAEEKGTLSCDEGGMAIFRIHDGGNEKFLHLFNCHNGYYGHGFTFAVGDQGIREGCL